MRHWLFHPLIFYPLVLALAAAVIILSLQPQALPRPAAAVAGEIQGRTLVLEGAAFDAPQDPPEQYVTVVRDALGQAQSLRIAVLPDLGAPTAAETGVVIRLDPASAALISGKRLNVEIAYRPLPVNAAPELAVRAEAAGPSPWVTQPIPPLSGSVQYVLPPARNVSGIGLRPLIGGHAMTFGVEIVSIRITPLPRRRAPN